MELQPNLTTGKWSGFNAAVSIALVEESTATVTRNRDVKSYNLIVPKITDTEIRNSRAGIDLQLVYLLIFMSPRWG